MFVPLFEKKKGNNELHVVVQMLDVYCLGAQTVATCSLLKLVWPLVPNNL